MYMGGGELMISLPKIKIKYFKFKLTISDSVLSTDVF